MRTYFSTCLLLLVTFFCTGLRESRGQQWYSLFDGKSLSNWRVGNHAASFSVDSGMIIVHGKTAHLFYDGEILNHDFTNFEFKAEVMTYPGANSGIYFHTAYQRRGWPDKGYEVQVNNSHTDWRRTGSLYGIKDIREVYVKDYEWYTESIRVEGKKITIRINDKTVVEYTEPDDVTRPLRRLSSGTFALQGHDPGSIVHYRNIQVRPL